MKRKLTLPLIMMGGACIIILSGAAVLSSTGYSYATGSPSDGMDCSACHSGGATPTTATITASPAFGGSGNNLTYTPGATYTITVQEGGYSLFGFDVEIMNSNSTTATTDAGTLTALTNCALGATGPTNITHTSPISSGSSATFMWVAPSGGTAYLYSSVLGVNGNGRTSGDNVKLVSYTLTPAATGTPPVAAFSTASTTVCTGTSLSLTDNSTNSPTTWSWTMTGGTPASSTLQNPTVTYSTAGTKTITLVATNASGSSSPVTKTVTVNATPTVTVNSATICNGQAASLQASGATTYSWSSGATTSSVSVNPTATTSYTLTGASAAGCTNTAVATVTVNSLPVITVNSSTVCSGTSAVLQASGATTYNWSSGGTAATTTVTPTATTVYTVTGLNGNCSSSATSTVTVNPSPSVTANAPVICAGQSAVLQASGATTYSWNTGATSASTTVTPGATTIYTVMGTSSNCNKTITTTVTVNAVPVISVNSPVVCAGQSAVLQASGATTYSWNTGATSSSATVTPTSTSVYTVTGTSNNCNGTATSTVTVNTVPVITVNSSSVCSGQSAVLHANGATTYSWNTGATSSSATVTPTSTSVYTVTGTSNNCNATATTTVVVNPRPVISVSSQTVCLTQFSATLTASGASTYSWSTGASGNSIVVTPSSTTVYTVIGTNANNCSSVTTETVAGHICSTDISNYSSSNGVVLYPNPAGNFLTIAVASAEEKTTIEMIDLTGRIILTGATERGNTTLNLSEIAEGSYYIKIKQADGNTTTKLILVER